VGKSFVRFHILMSGVGAFVLSEVITVKHRLVDVDIQAKTVTSNMAIGFC